MLSLDATQRAIIASDSMLVSWLFAVTNGQSTPTTYYWSTKAYTFDEQPYEFRILPASFAGIRMSRQKSELGIIAPSTLTFEIADPDIEFFAPDFHGGKVLVKLVIGDGTDEEIIRSWLFKIQDAVKSYKRIRFDCEDFLSQYLVGAYPNTPLVRDLFPSSDSLPDDNVCVPVPFGTAYVPLRSVYVPEAISVSGTTIAAVGSASGANCKFTDSASGFGSVEVGRYITVTGFTEGANNGTFRVLSVSAAEIQIGKDEGLVDEAAEDSVSITQGARYYLIGPDGLTYTIGEVRSPRLWGRRSEWASGGYTFTQSAKSDGTNIWKVFQPIIYDLNTDGTPEACGLWQQGDQFLDMPTLFSRSDTSSTTDPADIIEVVLEDMGVPSAYIDTGAGSSFEAASTTYASWGLEFNGAFWYKMEREKALSLLLTMCHSTLIIGEKIGLHVLSAVSQKTLSSVHIKKEQDVGEGTFVRSTSRSRDVSDSGYIAWQQSGEAQDKFLKTLVAAKSATALPSGDVLEIPFVQDSQDAQKIGSLHYQRKFLKTGEVSFSGKPLLLALQPDDTITVDPFASDDLIAHYRFDEGAGAMIKDRSGNDLDGTLYNTEAADRIHGGPGDMIYFNEGTADGDEYASVPDDDLLDGIRTIAAWINPVAGMSDASWAHILVCKHGTAWFGLYISYLASPNEIVATLEDSAYGQSYATYSLPAYNTWYHVALVADASAMRVRLYVNGVYVSQGAVIIDFLGGGTDMSGQPVRIGGGLAGEYSAVKIADVRLYDRALTAAEILELYRRQGDYGASFDALVGEVFIRRDGAVDFTCDTFSALLDDWEDLSPAALTIADDDTLSSWQPVVAGGLSAKDIGRAGFEVWGFPYLVCSPTPNHGEFTDIQAAINALTQSRHNGIFLRNGTYALSAPIYLVDRDSEIIGESQGGVIVQNHAGDHGFVLHDLTKQFVFSSLSIASQNVASYSRMIYAYGTSEASNSSRVRIDKVSLALVDNGSPWGTGDYGVYLENGSGLFTLDEVEINDGKFALYAIHYSNVRMIKSLLEDQTYRAVEIEDVSDCFLEGNKIEDFQGQGILVTTAEIVKIVDNILKAKNDSSGNSQTTRGIGVSAYSGLSAIVKGNSVRIVNTRASDYVTGIYFGSAPEAICTGNSVFINIGNTRSTYGLSIGADDIQCANNGVVLDNGDTTGTHYGLWTSGSRGVLQGNSINLVNSDAKDIGIYLGAAAANNQGGDNITYNVGTSISDSGTGNSVTAKDV